MDFSIKEVGKRYLGERYTLRARTICNSIGSLRARERNLLLGSEGSFIVKYPSESNTIMANI